MSIELLESFDSMAGLRRGLRTLANDREVLAGIPMLLDGQRLVVEPTYEYAGLGDIGKEEYAPVDYEVTGTIRGRTGLRYAITREASGKYTCWPILGSSHKADALINTIGASDAWGIEQEQVALKTLAELVSHRKFKQYLLTGMFLESSKKSGIQYIFRKLHPTVALSRSEPIKILCTLCMHPIAYYEGSWAGAMCPTDDVIAHLMLMRGDERRFWARSNQHPPSDPGSGL